MAAAQPRSCRSYWGWHPLTPEWADRVVACAPVRAGDVVVDLGAGDGALTLPLARLGCRVLAVELHPRRAATLRERFVGTRVAVVERDIDSFSWPGHPFRVVANPPYAGINAVVRRLLAVPRLRSADLVVAERAARGLVNRCGDRLELGPRVPRGAFVNRPPEDARVIRIRRRGGPVG
ncbi:MAG TPA: rRNA adenine N-6-methyltransferase family protein [Nocardioides sp.]|nr:rRNA adenine N-6-methyltransferase family protein [Nocardioides sp.]